MREVEETTVGFNTFQRLVGCRGVTGGGARMSVLSNPRTREADLSSFGVEPLDPLTFALVGFVVALTAAVSAIGPAWRAARIDPVVALRSQ